MLLKTVKKRLQSKGTQIKYMILIGVAMLILLAISQVYTYRTLESIMPNILSTEIGNKIRALQTQLLLIGGSYIILILGIGVYIIHRLSKLRVLIVDDDKVTRNIIKLFIEEEYPKAAIYEAKDGFTAGEVLGSVGIHVMTLDIMMPGMNGFEVLEKLKEYPKLGAPETIVITAHQTEGIEEKVRTLGARSIMYKPFEKDDLIEEIDRIIS